MAKPKTISPDPWIGFEPMADRKRVEPVHPPGARYIRARTSAGVTQQAAVLGLELITDITYDQGDFEYGAWAVPAGDDRWHEGDIAHHCGAFVGAHLYSAGRLVCPGHPDYDDLEASAT
jgi:hypothetical protein